MAGLKGAGLGFVALALAAFMGGEGVAALTVHVRSGAGLAAAMASADVDVALITTDITLSDEDWANYTLPIELRRNFTAMGQAGAQGLLPVVDLAAVKQKVRLHVGYTLTFKDMVLWRWRDGSSNQAPGLSLLTPTVTPPGINGTVAIARLENVDMLYRYCFPKWLGIRAAAIFVRPPELPGNNTLQWDYVWPNNCTVNSPWAHPQLRCYAYVGLYVDLAARGLDVDSSGKTTFPNGYMVQYLNAVGLCTDVMPDDCLAKLSPVGCSLFLNSQPEAPMPPRPPPLPPAPGSMDATSSGGTDTGTIVGAVVGGVIGGLLLAALLAWLLVTARRRRQADKAAAAKGKQEGRSSAAAGTSSGPDSSSTGVVVVDMASAGNSKETGPAVRAGTMGSSSTGDFMGAGSELSASGSGGQGGRAAAVKSKAVASPKSAAGGSPRHPNTPGTPGKTMEETPVVTQQTPARADIKLDVRVGVPPLGATGGLGGERGAAPLAGTASSYDTVTDSAGMSSISPVTASMDAALASEERARAAAVAGAAGSSAAGSAAAAAAGSAASAAAAATEAGGPEHSGVVQSEVKLTAVTLGKGGFGRVMEGEWQGRRVAVKMVADTHTFGGSPDVLLKSFKQELEVLARVQHANIVQLLAACTTPPRLCLIMELMETSLEKVLHGPRPLRLPLRKVLFIAAEIAKGLEALHPTVIHRDLKPANVLIRDAAGPKPVVKITDFGLSRLRNTTVVTATPGAGTPAYLAPECYEAADGGTGSITYKADMYSLGVLLYEMLAHTRPWASLLPVQIAVEVAVQGKRLPLDKLSPSRCPAALRELITQMWDVDPLRRPAAAEVVKSLYMMIEAMDSAQDDGQPSSPAAAAAQDDAAVAAAAAAGGSGNQEQQTAAKEDEAEDYDFGPILAVSLPSEGAWRR